MVISLVKFQTTNTYAATKNKIIIRYTSTLGMLDFSTHVLLIATSTSFSFVALSSLLQTL